MLGLYNTYVKKLETVLDNFDWEIVHQLTLSLQEAWRTKNTVFLCGNGGSAADSQHIAAELIGRFKKERKAIPALALTVDSSSIPIMTSSQSSGAERERRPFACKYIAFCFVEYLS